MSTITPKLQGVSPEEEGDSIWHVYEVVRDFAIEKSLVKSYLETERPGFSNSTSENPKKDHAKAVIMTIANLHEKLQDHDLLYEWRQQNTDLGSSFIKTSVQDAICALESLHFNNLKSTDQHLIASLLEKLHLLGKQVTWRCDLLERAEVRIDCLMEILVLKMHLYCRNIKILTGKLIVNRKLRA